MKNYLHLSCIALIVMSMSCQKEEQVLLTEVSNSMAQSDGKFKKEIIVTDESGKNQAFYVIYSDDENLLSKFLAANELSLKINVEDVETLKSFDLSSQTRLKSGAENFDLNQEPKIIIELVTANLEDYVNSYSLEVNSTRLKSASDFIFGYPVGYTTSNNFIGAVHRGYGYEFVAQFEYKKHWYSFWTDFTVNGGNAWFVYPSNEYYISLDEDYDFYKRRIIIYPHYYQNGINYSIAYSRNDFRGQFCTIGSYDTANCYVGTAPSGTSAFIWGPDSNNLNFYYTPINGNQCPLAGSSFDGNACYVMGIPSSCDPFVWNNNWYVKTDIIE